MVIALCTIILSLFGCSGSSATRVSGDPLLDLRNPSLSLVNRSEAASMAWAEVEAGVRDRDRTRSTFKDLAWSRQTAPLLRAQLVDHLMSDQDPSGEADSIRLAKLMLPSEINPRVVAVISHIAATRGWTSLAPALIRSLSNEEMPGKLKDRPESFALTRLFPKTPLETVVFEVFLDPGDDPTGKQAAVLRWTDRVRQDAWALLSALDPEREKRPGLIANAAQQVNGIAPESAILIKDLHDAWQQLRVLPDTAMELEWFESIRRPSYVANAEPNALWWTQSAKAIEAQPEIRTQFGSGLRLRHLEAIRWATQFEPDLVNADRASLLATLHARLDRRPRNTRTKELGSRARRRERLADWQSQLSWADLLTIIVVDLSIQNGEFIDTIFQHTKLDRADTTTEYGGIIESKRQDDRGFRAILFRPREAQRQGDNAFVASDDLLRFSDRALAHYHLQVQRVNNEAFAGPSFADLEYCKRSGRTCVVFTSISKVKLGVDLYQPDGVVIDLGEIMMPVP